MEQQGIGAILNTASVVQMTPNKGVFVVCQRTRWDTFTYTNRGQMWEARAIDGRILAAAPGD